jgi:hypothetical protein
VNESSDIRACPGCDLLQRIPTLSPGGKARCARCNEPLAARPRGPLELPLALTLAAAVVFIIANTQPLMGLSAVGRHGSTTIIGGAYQMWMHGLEATAAPLRLAALSGLLRASCAVGRPRRAVLGRRALGQVVRPVDRVLRPGTSSRCQMRLATVVPGVSVCRRRAGRSVYRHSCGLDSREAWTRVE